jgi:hypothetical protein
MHECCSKLQIFVKKVQYVMDEKKQIDTDLQ